MPEESGRLGAFLQGKLPELSAKKVKRLLELYGCTVNGKVEHFASRAVRGGDVVTWPGAERDVVAAAHWLWQDEDLLIIDKAPGLRSDIQSIKATYRHQGDLHLVHRLDAPTSGIMILAKNTYTKKHLEEQFATRNVRKTYWAVVTGQPKASSGMIDKPLRHAMQQGGQTIWRVAKEGEGQSAQTAYRCLAYGPDSTLIECKPITGRTHQIRVHLHYLGHPILGDNVYHLVAQKRSSGRLMLHALNIAFEHPRSAEPLFFESEVPADMQAMIARLRPAPA